MPKRDSTEMVIAHQRAPADADPDELVEMEVVAAMVVDDHSAGGSRAGAAGAAGGASGAGGVAAAAAPTPGGVAAAAAPRTVAGASSTHAPVLRGLEYMDLATRTEFMEWIIGLRPGSHIENVEGYGACCLFALAAAVWPSVLEHGEIVLVGTITSSRTPKATMKDRCGERFMRDAAVNAALRCHNEEMTGAVVYVRVAPRTTALASPPPSAIITSRLHNFNRRRPRRKTLSDRPSL